ncbi:MAG: hypothetical protein AB7G20_09765 [Sulfurimonas sp.]|uniref:hypothetical protein n=1 Tax=Sulfurimonas sp. TaxID=2022749 RepID=UPI003D0E1E16
MNAMRVRKNFLLDGDIVDKATDVLKQKHKNLTEAINLYFQAIAKDPTLVDTVEHIASKRTGSFIGMLDGKIGDEDFKQIKKGYHESIS